MSNMLHPRHISVDADPASIKPLGDMVLVKKLSDVEQQRNGIILPPHKQTAEVDWVPQIGEVVACGPGDAMLRFWCLPCYLGTHTMSVEAIHRKGFPVCEFCNRPLSLMDEGTYTARAPMHVSPGDQVIYQRWPDNDVVIRGESYTIIHEQQAILAVLESEAA